MLVGQPPSTHSYSIAHARDYPCYPRQACPISYFRDQLFSTSCHNDRYSPSSSVDCGSDIHLKTSISPLLIHIKLYYLLKLLLYSTNEISAATITASIRIATN